MIHNCIGSHTGTLSYVPHISVVLVTGGGDKWRGRRDHLDLDSVELLNTNGSWNCPMPIMPETRSGHTQTGLVTCGGNGGGKSCITFIRGDVNWKKSHNLNQWESSQKRKYHTSWASPRGIMLIGGTWQMGQTSEILRKDGGSTNGFRVAPIGYHACSIEETETVTLTGGDYTLWEARVTRYKADGSGRRLPDLKTGRYRHACGHYTTSANSIVYS